MRKEQVVLVTGAARGIGKEICLNMAKEGYDVSVNYRTKTDEIEELKSKIESYGVKCALVQGDIGSFEECENMVRETLAKEFGTKIRDMKSYNLLVDACVHNLKKKQLKSLDIDSVDEL